MARPIAALTNFLGGGHLRRGRPAGVVITYDGTAPSKQGAKLTRLSIASRTGLADIVDQTHTKEPRRMNE